MYLVQYIGLWATAAAFRVFGNLRAFGLWSLTVAEGQGVGLIRARARSRTNNSTTVTTVRRSTATEEG